MYIENVSLHNINTLFDIAASNLEQKEMVGKMYDRNIVELCNQMSITLTISSLSFMEYYHMKYMLQDGSMQKFYWEFRMPYVNSAYPEISSDIRQLKRVLDDNAFKRIIPPAVVDGSTVARFSGKDLGMIFGTDPMREFFVKVIPEEKLYDEDHNFNRAYVHEIFKNGIITDSDIEEIFNNTILTYFYTNMVRNYEYVDLLSDFSLQRFFVDQPVKLISVNDINANSKSFIDDLKQYINECSAPLFDTKLIFSFHSDFATFLEMYSEFPKKCFTAIESLRIPHSVLNEDMSIKGLSPQINQVIETLRKNINDSYGVKGKEIPYSSLIPANAMIHYIMELTLQDINTFVSNIKFSSYGGYIKNNYDTILQFGRLVYGLIDE